MEANPHWNENIQRWQFLIDSYLGGKDYKDGKYLAEYIMETISEYQGRLDNTPLDNHVKAIVAIYNSFLFRTPPKRDFGSLGNDSSLPSFLKDADLDGRSFDAVMRDISTYSSVYGNCWIIIDKPQSSAYTRAEELSQGLRPYISIYTPENVLDWNYVRGENGSYHLDYIKVFEGQSNGRSIYRIYTPDVISVVSASENDSEVRIEMEIPNQLGVIPAVCVYGQRSPIKGVGVSDVGDVADVQRAIYNELNEVYQLLTLTNHPSLVKTASTSASAGAGAIIQMPEDLQGELKPYLLQPSGASIDGLLNSLRFKIESIDRMAHMGGIRSIETRRLSGVALATEFQLLNARLAEKGDNLEHAEEQLWRLYARWQGMVWDGEIDYPNSFNIQDKYNDMNMLKLAKDAGPKSDVVNEEIERQILRLLVNDDFRFEQLVEHINENETAEINEEMDELALIEKAKSVLTMPTTGNEVVDMELNKKVIEEVVNDTASLEAIYAAYQAANPTLPVTFELSSCPLPLQDPKINLANHMVAIDQANLGPADPRKPETVFWMKKSELWNTSVGEARTRLCSNCSHYSSTTEMTNCIKNGPGGQIKASNLPVSPQWADVADPSGYCDLYDITCTATRTCDNWDAGGPIDNQKAEDLGLGE